MLPIEDDLLQIGRFRHPGGGHALSLYLDTDPARLPGRSLRAQIEELLGPVRESLQGSAADRARLEAAVHAVIRGISVLDAPPRAVAAFASDDLQFIRVVPLPERIEPAAHWGPTFRIKPLLAALDEHERTIVVLVDEAHGRVFQVFLGQIEEVAHVAGEADGQDPLGSAQPAGKGGADGGVSGTRYGPPSMLQRHEWHVRKHAQRVLAAMRDGGPWPADRLFVAGNGENVHELLYLLPKRVRDRTRLISRIGPNTEPQGVLERVLEAQGEAEREEEEELLDNLTDRDRNRSVFGTVAVAHAVTEVRVHTLVYASDASIRGAECPGCGWLAAGPLDATCPRCQAEMEPTADLLEEMVARVLRAGGRVEEVRGPALKTLNRLGTVAALLRSVSATNERAPPRPRMSRLWM